VISSSTRIYACTVAVDMRRSFDGLALAARQHVGGNPQGGDLFVFVNRRGNRLKALWWDRTGYCLLYKRLERALFRLPRAAEPGAESVAIDAGMLAKILEGEALPPRREKKRRRR
jgi:transposase